MAILFSITSSASVLAEEQAALEKPVVTVVSESEASSIVNPGSTRLIPGDGMEYGGGQRCKGQGGMRHGGGKHGKAGLGKDRELEQRLDMIEARMAKIEAMLEMLIRR